MACINVLNQERSLSYPFARAPVDDMVGNALDAGKIGVDRSTITAKSGLSVDQWQQGCLHMLCIQLFQLKVCGMLSTITNHLDRSLIPTCAARFADAALFVCRSWQLVLTLEGLHKERFIDLNDSPSSAACCWAAQATERCRQRKVVSLL